MAWISRQALRSASLALLGLSAFVAGRAVVRRARAFDWRGKVVIITGGTRGLGLLLAEEIGRRGASVAVCGRDEDAAVEAERHLAQLGGKVLVHRADLGERGQAERFVERVVSAWGRVDVLINDAGVIKVAPLESTPIAGVEEAMRSNFWTAAYMTYAALPHLLQREGSRVVNISSIGGRVAIPHLLAYSASKFALQGFSEGLFAELHAAGIPVTTVLPSPMRTGSFYNAEFSGKVRDEFNWFSLGASLPIVSISARRAALRIIRAAELGAVEVHLGLPSHALSFLHGVAPRSTQRLMALVARLLPEPGGSPDDVQRGREVSSPLMRSIFLRLGNLAAAQNNESPPADAR
jgi:NAD(P)-dependent dehydrogenase (short-subunit alcohol dehydrogenase family)